MEWKILYSEKFQILHFSLKHPLAPGDIAGLHLPRLDTSRGVILSGKKGPIWLFGFLVHECHPHPFVGIYEPRFKIAVIIERHTPDAPAVGSVLDLSKYAEELDQ